MKDRDRVLKLLDSLPGKAKATVKGEVRTFPYWNGFDRGLDFAIQAIREELSFPLDHDPEPPREKIEKREPFAFLDGDEPEECAICGSTGGSTGSECPNCGFFE